jgi:hypothetical protein
MGKVVIIGSGISGLVAARALVQHGHEVIVLEKSRSLAGRCATRRWQSHIVDHGAQFFTASSPEFLMDLKESLGDGLKKIAGKVVNEIGTEIETSGGIRYYYAPGNNRMGKVLSDGIEIKKETLVESIQATSAGWSVTLGSDSLAAEIEKENFDAVLVTTPWPQASQILGLPAEPNASSYIPTLTAFFEFAGEGSRQSAATYAVSIRDANEPLAWSACENVKSGRIQGDVTVFVVHASEKFSQQWLEAPPAEYLPILQRRLQEVWEISSEPLNTFAHRWRFARKAAAIALPELPAGVFVAGDSRVESKIEAVWMDGLKAAGEVDQYLKAET